MNSNYLLAFVLAVFSTSLISAEQASQLPDNQELAKIFEMDQADRKPGPDAIDWDIVNERDADRRLHTLEILRRGEVRTSEDFRRAAYIFQHGKTIGDYRLALSLAWVAATIDPDNEDAKRLTAAAWDRLLMNQGQPQWYGTQFQRKHGESEWTLYDIQEDAVSDKQRQELHVPTLAETKERLKKLNGQ